jgi:hypothetical protein
MLKSKTTLRIGISTSLVAIAFVMATVLTQVSSNIDATASAGMSVPISQISEKSTLDTAKQKAQFAMKVPTKIPSSALKEVYADRDGSGVMILYSDPSMKPINQIGGADIGSAEIVLTMGKKDFNPIPAAIDKNILPMKIVSIYPNGTEVIKGYVPQTPADFVSVAINGIEGIGLESTSDDAGNVYPSTIRWWDNKTLYTLYGHTSVQELVKIAESMR